VGGDARARPRGHRVQGPPLGLGAAAEPAVAQVQALEVRDLPGDRLGRVYRS
jgi:hypothetical protein